MTFLQIQNKCRKLLPLLIAGILIITANACGNSKVPYSESDLVADLGNYLNQSTDMCAECIIKIKYNQLKENEMRMLQSYLKNISIEGVSGEYPNYSATLLIPDNEELADKIRSDTTGIGVAYASALATDATQDELRDLVTEYLTSTLLGNNVPKEEVTIQVSVNDEQKWDSDSELASIIITFLQYDFAEALSKVGGQNETTGASVTVSNADAWVEITTDKSFICSKDGVKYLIDDISLLQGEAALNKVQELSSTNSILVPSADDRLAYLEYTATNICETAGTLMNSFRFKDGDHLLSNTGVSVFGLRDSAKLEAGESKVFSTFLIGNSTSDIVWYSADIIGSYVIVP